MFSVRGDYRHSCPSRLVCVRAFVCLPLLLCSKAVTLMSDRHLLQCCYYFHIRGNLSPQMRVHTKARSAKTSSVSSLSRALPLLLLCFTALKWSNDDTEHLQPENSLLNNFSLPLLG